MQEPPLPKRLLYLFLGAPGSGKGTQTLLLSEKLRLSRIEMSKLLEQRFQRSKPGETVEIQGKTYSVDVQKERWNTGFLNESAFVADTVMAKLRKLVEEGEPILLDGFPRSIEQAEYLLPFIEQTLGKDKVVVLYLDISEKDSIFRNTHRRICELLRHAILYAPETEHLTLCPIDGSKLVRRELDAPETIKVRLQEFRKLTLPLLEYFREHGIEVAEISAEGTVSEVFSRILGKLEELNGK